MNQHDKNKLQRKLIVATIAACFGTAQAAPVAPQVVAGQASFSQQGNVFSITNTPNTIINWQSFSVGQNEVTRFIQQNADSKVLNRITGQDPSRILGSLQSNGKVFLINPNGVLFGKDARIDVNGLVASSLALSNADFLAGRNNFKADGVAGKVENQGRISTPQGGQVYLIAPNVENNGIINAPNGDIILAAGRSVQLVDSANPALQVVVSAPEDQALNLGQVVAQGGRIGIYGALVNQRGSVNADSAVVGENGRIVLKASGRTTLGADSVTSARGAGKGGEIQVLGKQVALVDQARVDASGRQGGGTVLVGGDYQGANAAVQNAAQTYVGEHAVIAADALDNGDGGKVIVWGDDAAAVYGSINARGGAHGGKGGFIETSAHALDISAIRVDASAARGAHGTWLIDPYDLEIKETLLGDFLFPIVGFLDGLLSGKSTIARSVINGATADVKLQAKHDLIVTDAISINKAGVGIVMQAGNNINVNSAITTKGGQISLSANDSSIGASGNGTVSVNAPLSAGSGNITLSGKTVSFGDAGVSGNNITVNASAIKLAPGAPELQLRAKTDITLGGPLSITASGTGVTAQAGNNINVNGAVTTNRGQISLSADDATMGASGSGAVKVNAALNAGSGDITLSGKTITVGAVGVSGANVALKANTITTHANGAVSASGDMLSMVGSTLDLKSKLDSAGEMVLLGAGKAEYSNEITADTLYISGSEIKLDKANVNAIAARSTGKIEINGTGTRGLTLATTSENADLLGVNFHGITSGDRVTLNAKSISQDYDAPITAQELVLKTTGSVNLDDSSDNHVDKLSASNVSNFRYKDSGALSVESVSLASSAGDAGITIEAGDLTVKNVDGRSNGVNLSGSTLTLAGNASVKGGSIDLVANDGVLVTETGSKVEGNWIGFTADAIDLKGTVKSTASNVANGGVTFRTANGGDITLGDGNGTESGLVLKNAGLRNITAYTIYVDNSSGYGATSYGNYGGYGGAININNLDLTGGKLSGLLNVSANDIQLGNVVKLPTAALELNAGGAVNGNAMLSAKSLTVNADSFVLSGNAGTGINVGAGTVKIDSGRSVVLGGSTASGDTNLSNTALQSISAGKLAISTDSAITVTSAVDTPALSYDLQAGTALTVGAAFAANSLQLTSDLMNFSGTITAKNAAIRPYTASYDIHAGAGNSCSGPCLSLTSLGAVHAAAITLGATDGSFTGSIDIGNMGLDAATTRLALLAPQGGVTQTAGIAVKELAVVTGANTVLDGQVNNVEKLAVSSGGHIFFVNDSDLAVGSLKDSGASGSVLYNISGITAEEDVTLNVAGSLARDDGVITADKLSMIAGGSIGAAGKSMQTKVNALSAVSTAGSGSSSIYITNNRAGYANALTINNVTIGSGNGGSISIDNYGATTLAAAATVSTDSGNIAIRAHSPLTILGRVLSAGGSITLEAGSSGSANDDLVIGPSAVVRSASGNITLLAGDEVTKQTGSTIEALAGRITTTAKNNTTIIEPPPVTPPPVTPPPVTPPPVTPPPVEPPPVTPPPVEPPPVTPPPVTPPPVTPPPVTPPPVTPPPVEPPPVTPPVTVDQCQLTPNLPACQVIAPPTVAEPVKPVQSASNEVIKTMAKPGEGHAGQGSSGGGNSAPSSTPDDARKEEKHEQASDKGEQKNESVKKMYCN